MAEKSWKAWTAEEDAFVREHVGILTSAEIADALDRSKCSVDQRRHSLGWNSHEKRSQSAKHHAWVRRLELQLGESISAFLTRRYLHDRATYRELCAELGINTRSLMKLIRESGIEPISSAEAVRRQLAADPNFLRPMVEAARKPSAAAKRALSRQENWERRCTEQELQFLAVLRSAGLNPVPQLAVGTYNIDFAFPDIMLGVELDPLWHKTPERVKRDTVRDARLTDAGWEIMRLEARASEGFNVRKISEAVKRCASTHPR